MTREQKIHFRDDLRNARAGALADAEGYSRLVVSIERLGKFCNGGRGTLGKVAPKLTALASDSSLAQTVPLSHPRWHTGFELLLNQLREARNAAVHEGAMARHLASHAAKVAIVLEDSLMVGLDRVGDYMVRNPLCASMWQPLSFVRQMMLESSYSFLPLDVSTQGASEWRLLSDFELARFIRSQADKTRAFNMTVDDAAREGMVLVKPHVCQFDVSVVEALRECAGHPILVIDGEEREILGIATPFDLL